MAVADILLSPATVWHAPVGEALPSENSIGYGVAWGGNWVNCGYTSAPLTITYKRATYEVKSEQVPNVLKELVTAEDLTLDTTLIEATGSNLQLAFNGSTLTETPAGGAQVAKTEIEAGGATSVDQLAWGFEGYYQSSAGVKYPVRVFVFIGSPTLNGNLTFARNKELGIGLTIKAYLDVGKTVGKGLLKIEKVYAPHT